MNCRTLLTLLSPLPLGLASCGSAATGDNAAPKTADVPPFTVEIVSIRPDGTIWLLEDGEQVDSGHLLKLTPRAP